MRSRQFLLLYGERQRTAHLRRFRVASLLRSITRNRSQYPATFGQPYLFMGQRRDASPQWRGGLKTAPKELSSKRP